MRALNHPGLPMIETSIDFPVAMPVVEHESGDEFAVLLYAYSSRRAVAHAHLALCPRDDVF